MVQYIFLLQIVLEIYTEMFVTFSRQTLLEDSRLVNIRNLRWKYEKYVWLTLGILTENQ